MPRARFHKLPLERQRAIQRAARDAFAASGFNDASFNAIIDAAGISKGSMYYYFDGKEDLYAYVVGAELGQLLAAAGPFAVPSTTDPRAYWSTLEGYYLRLMSALAASPETAALARAWVSASANPRLQASEREMAAAALPWFEATLAAGQRAGAVRDDVPTGLLIAVVFAMGRAMDAWLVTQRLDETSMREAVRKMLDMIRRALEPG